MKRKAGITIVVLSVLFMVFLTQGTANTVYAGTTREKEVTVTEIYLEYNYEYAILEELESKNYEAEDITIISHQFKEITLNILYRGEFKDSSAVGGSVEKEEYIDISLKGNYDSIESVIKAIEADIFKQRENLISIVAFGDDFVASKAVILVKYKYPEDFVIGEELGLPYTKADGSYELSPMTLYISRSRVSYAIEDGGEFFIPEDDYEFLIFNNGMYPLGENRIIDLNQRAYFNVEWKSFKKAGTIVGKIDKVEKNYYIADVIRRNRYTIGHQYYYKLSDIIEDWNGDNRELFEYDSKTKTLYFRKKPLAKDKLQKDEIYEFVKKAIKGCNTDKEKLKAIHDAIVTKYNVYEDIWYMDAFPKYVMRDNLYDAKHLMVDKEYKRNAFADLFKECCNRLLIPNNIIGDGEGLDWNRVYLGGKVYHVDTATDAVITHSTKDLKPYRRFFLKSAYEFMGTHYWEEEDYTPEKFSKNWKLIDRNNIKTTDDLRRAATYAAYLSKDGKKRTYTFKIKGSNVNTYCETYIYNYNFVSNINASYKKNVLTITFN
ncbi:hypothetical protein acsn021_23760 [Anaerocolumna cellulosilytica]|uniref:Uncharacterized protein n=1 Tax=Anaerocolumna cellulosilytica TaxID=433286 RepID=A0A6S6R423_9FIRM|nr:hypothetical protein [Anaerocolumna cellulosilytica]MBB5193979.1 hypothetical protein [Anaerocolumna cellulosilytica]BCJ94807.1 hypothetical protein acsn021_23760 [Anaerocolumna cellulosilytica]